MGRRFAGAALAALLVISCAAAARGDRPEHRVVGDWLLTNVLNRFGDGGSAFATVMTQDTALVMRCVDRRPALLFWLPDRHPDGPFAQGQSYYFKIVGDWSALKDVVGVAISPSQKLISEDTALIRSLFDSSRIAIQIKSSPLMFESAYLIRGAAQAFAFASNECPLE